MSDATQYIVKNIKKSYEVYKALERMQEEVTSALDHAIRDRYEDWLSSDWKFSEYTLQDDWGISLTLKDFCFVDEDGNEDSYFWLRLDLDSDESIWKMLGQSTDE